MVEGLWFERCMVLGVWIIVSKGGGFRVYC
jgi:hypothetical protein